MNSTKAKQVAWKYGWDLWYDRSQASWTMTRLPNVEHENLPAVYLSPSVLRQLDVVQFRTRYAALHLIETK